MTDSAALRHLPSVNAVLEHDAVRSLIETRGRETVLGWVRIELDDLRTKLIAGETDDQRDGLLIEVVDRVFKQATATSQTAIGPVINATGVILHTGLGRAPLCAAAKTALAGIAGAGNIEIDLATTDRRYRGHQLQPAWRTLTGCQDSLVVNNNAAATLLTLQALCAGREVVISRGQLIEIGGSFRLPEIFQLSGAVLREVGTTNRTTLRDYERAINDNTAALMLVHPSNYRIVGFTTSPGVRELAELAHANGLVMIDDVGSGCLVDVTKFGVPPEPTFPESIAAGADVVLGSGDKLLGGPQAGVILGRKEPVEIIRKHPLARAVRVGKLTLAALAATLDSYLRGTAEEDMPVLRLLSAEVDGLLFRANQIKQELAAEASITVEVREESALVGGGSLPAVELPTAVVSVQHREHSADDFAKRLRLGSPRLFPRIHNDAVLIDLRSVLPEDDSQITLALRCAVELVGD